jgi:glutathione synthase/RimK-type ligase-like ATP-grasp enzyme
MRLIGLYRETELSPGRHRSNDALLLEEVAAALRAQGFSVDLMTADEADAKRPRAALVFTMCQGPRALEFLKHWEQRGARLVNSPRASLNTYRDHLPALMVGAGISFPSTTLVNTSDGADAAAILASAQGGLWLKRGDVHASVTADVQWVDSVEALDAGLREFAARGVGRAAVQHHRAGDELKFYGVAGGAFFYWFYSKESTGASARFSFDAAALHRLANAAADAAGLDIFGGDVIVSADGELTLIDLNDWPSFAPCRHQASVAIAAHLMRRVDAAWNPSLVSSANQSAV